ncbi:concanavalin A-like lectin/glucanase [Massarina eburnea CBS 473.64]|uniref:Concanavalin A-like lectin/glucanase n=1 Tax=Massarina eburnea CBS 473.64 TaxID=1395130 RepID=A0A6A6RMB7_9PLEO|nr:concanavalin A-like lectin/glucanase [Massarina eburnea CBS 473.64]
MWTVRDTMGAMPWLILAMSRLASADCECGYSVNKTSDADHLLFYDLQENDFLHTNGDNVTEYGWRPQEYNQTKEQTLAPYGKTNEVANVEFNPLKDAQSWSGDSEKGGDAGLKLWVRGDHSDGYVPGAELASVRKDMLYGSFRAGMKTGSGGTCGAWYWFLKNSVEIDMELLTKDFNNSQGAINLVLQSPQSAADRTAEGTNTLHVQHLDFRPDQSFHEYRYDWMPGSVTFYIDGQAVYTTTDNVPEDGGYMFMNHWSTGNPKWSAGPPSSDTAMTVSYAKAYFNSSDTARSDAYKKRCPTFDPAKVCQIPDQTKAPNGADAKTYFISQDGAGKTPDQQTYKLTSGASNLFATSSTIYMSIFVAFFSWALL